VLLHIVHRPAQRSRDWILFPSSGVYLHDDHNNELGITILDIIHRPLFYLKHNDSEIGFYLRFQVAPTQFDSIARASPLLRSEDVDRMLSPKNAF
jgi:hypothetical protein